MMLALAGILSEVNWGIVAPIVGGVGLFLTGFAQLYGGRTKVKEVTLNHHDTLLAAMQSHLDYMSARDTMNVQRIDRLVEHTNQCEKENLELRLLVETSRREKVESERKLQEQINELRRQMEL